MKITNWQIMLMPKTACGRPYICRSPNELLDQLEPLDCFSTLDVAQAYHTIKIVDESKHVTAFTSPLGLFHFKAMAFRLLNAGARYSRFSEGLERKVNSKNLVNYVDDTLIFTLGVT